MIWILVLIALSFGLGAFLGAPYLPTRSEDAEAALDLAGVGKGTRIIDLGSGDGKLLLAASRRGAEAIGYEINPILYLISRARTWREGGIKVHFGSYWNRKLPETDVIYIFLIDRYMSKLDLKLKQELTHPTKVVSYTFKLPRPADQETRNLSLYTYP